MNAVGARLGIPWMGGDRSLFFDSVMEAIALDSFARIQEKGDVASRTICTYVPILSAIGVDQDGLKAYADSIMETSFGSKVMDSIREKEPIQTKGPIRNDAMPLLNTEDAREQNMISAFETHAKTMGIEIIDIRDHR